MSMPKHKLYLADAYSPLNSSKLVTGSDENESSVPGNINNSLSISHFIISLQGAQRDNSLINTPPSKKNMEKNKFDSKVPGPSSANGCNIISDTVTSKSDFDSDIMEVDFFSTFNQKLPYSKEEDELIVQFVLKGQNIFKVSSVSLWKHLEVKKDNPKRTYHSLKNRFWRNIRPYLFTTFRHLIKDKETVNRILMKFPELKKQMGVKNTLSKINLPAGKCSRNPPLKVPEAKQQENRDPDECQENAEGCARALECNEMSETPVFRANLLSSRSSPRNNTSFSRKVKFGKKSIFVLVSLTDRNHSEAPGSLMKISERFEKLRTKRKRFFCPTCGRYNRQIRQDYSSDSDEESDIIIPNSIDENKMLPKTLEKKFFNSNFKISHRTNHKIPSGNSGHNQSSQSLLNYNDEIDEYDENIQDKDEGNCKVPDASQLFSRKDAVKVESPAREIQDQEKSETIISKEEAATGIEKQWDSDSEIDIIYENTIAGFRQLINADEEKMLFKKCLYRNRDSIGFNSDSEKNLDSYFLESSPDVETPALIENYSALLQSDNSKTGSESLSNSHLANNMMKMLVKEKDRNKKS